MSGPQNVRTQLLPAREPVSPGRTAAVLQSRSNRSSAATEVRRRDRVGAMPSARVALGACKRGSASAGQRAER